MIWHPVCDAYAEKGTNLELCADWCTLRVSPNPPKTGPARNGCVYCKRTPSGVPLKRTFKMHGLFGLHVKRGLQIDDSLKPTVRRLNMVEPTHTHTMFFPPFGSPHSNAPSAMEPFRVVVPKPCSSTGKLSAIGFLGHSRCQASDNSSANHESMRSAFHGKKDEHSFEPRTELQHTRESYWQRPTRTARFVRGVVRASTVH